MEFVGVLQPSQLADIIRCKCEKVLIVDARTFCEFNTCHIINAVNVWSSKIRKKRLQQNSISVYDFLQQACHITLQDISFEEVVVYDQSASNPQTVPQDTFLHVLLVKLVSAFKKVYLLQGGFLEFQSQYYEMCEDSSQKGYLLTSFSQPCLPVSSIGPTKILPFLFLGSQHDANNKQLLLEHNISYELNVSTSCPKPEFLQDSHFLRISVNDNFSAKLLPHFGEAFRFIDKVREVGGRVLVHCLAGISRSPTIVISYVMKYLHLHYDEAYRYVKTRRPTISPNINFVGQLLEFDLHLFGKRVMMRSPLRPIYVDDNDLASSGVPSSVSSPLLKSSSSSCLSSCSEISFPFPLNRSLPSLRLNKSVEEVQCLSSHTHAHRQSPYSPPVDLDCLLFDFKLNESVKGCSSSKLPSSPVSRPSTPEFSVSANLYGDFYSKDSVPSSTGGTGPGVRRGTSKSEALRSHSFDENRSCVFSSKDSYRFSSTNKENEDLTARERDTGSLIPSEDRSCMMCEKRFPKKESFDEDEEEMEVTEKKEDEQQPKPSVEKGSLKVDLKVDLKDDTFRLIIPSQHTYLKRENSAPEHAHSREESLALPPKTMRSSSCRKVDLPHLPRSYSSSETYLNTRMRLEKQSSSCSVGGSSTRKSFSSDEVGRGFQGTGPPPTPPSSAGFHKESYTNPLELARCDSWSTSGLGSEISDWDSVQGDAQSMEDTQGPFDAVFAEVFPGENPTTVLKEGIKHPDIHMKPEEKIGLREKKTDLEQSNVASRKSCSSLVPEETLGTSPAPRPVSLPGVSGTYNVSDSNPNNADMGVDLDDGRDWSKDDGDKLSESWRKVPILVEHPPVNTKTMGDDVKYIMTWYKFDSSPLLDPSLGKGNLSPSSLETKKTSSPQTSTIKPTVPVIEVAKDSVTPPVGDDDLAPTTPEAEDEKGSLHERWRWWDNEFKKKIRNIKKNVSMTSWDSTEGDDDIDAEVGEKMAGFHLAQELMQSMEDLLEREICEIKERASSLSTRFGLTLGSLSDKSSSSVGDCDAKDTSVTCSPEEVLVQKKEGTPEVSTLSRESLLKKSAGTFLQETSAGTLLQETSAGTLLQETSAGTLLQETSAGPLLQEIDLRDASTFRREKSLRARSEPPLCIEENLYRVKSCPGIPNCKGTEGAKPSSRDQDIAFRFPRILLHKNGHSKRYSCSALDFRPALKPEFESCPDVSQSKSHGATTFSSSKSGSDASSPTSQSPFSRLLKVS